jgi:hypothetical protein
MNGLRKAQAMREAQPTPPVAPAAPPAAPPAINPLALPRSITQPAQNLTAGYDNTQAMQSAADPLAKYYEAVKANDVMDRQGDAAQARDAAGLTSARRALEKLQAEADPGVTPEGIRARATAKIVKKDGQVTETPQAPTPEASPAEAGPQRPAEPPVEQPVVEAPAPEKGVLLHTKVNGADREIAANATAEFAKTNAPQATLSRYQSSTEQKQARIRDRLLQASKDQDFQAENMDLMQHMDAIRHVRSRSALEAHITDASPETQAFLKRYFGPKWAKTVWNKK